MAIKPTFVALAAAALLSGCGSFAEDPLLQAARGVIGDLGNRGTGAAAPNPRDVLTRDIINQAALPLILVENTEQDTLATMVRNGINRSNETWRADDGATVTLSREGVLRATRGVGADLFSADISGTRAALAGGRNSEVRRLYVHVDGDLQELRTTFSCTISRGGTEQVVIFEQARTLTRVTETCRPEQADGTAFQNRFWVDGAGFAWLSEQWAGPQTGHFRIERLHR